MQAPWFLGTFDTHFMSDVSVPAVYTCSCLSSSCGERLYSLTTYWNNKSKAQKRLQSKYCVSANIFYLVRTSGLCHRPPFSIMIIKKSSLQTFFFFPADKSWVKNSDDGALRTGVLRERLWSGGGDVGLSSLYSVSLNLSCCSSRCGH